MNIDIFKYKAILYCSLVVMTTVYLGQIYTQQLSVKFVIQSYITVVFISIFCGMVTYLILLLVLYVSKNNNHNKADPSELVKPIFESNEAENQFDQISNSIHKIVTNNVEIPDFDSELVDDMRQKVIGMWMYVCMAYAYGVMLINYSGKNPNFMATADCDSFQNLVLDRLAKFRKRLASDYEDEYVNNEELTENVSRMISEVTEIVDDSLVGKKQDVDLDNLIDYLVKNINNKSSGLPIDLKEYTLRVLEE